MNHPLGMGKGKRGADSRRTLGRPPTSEMYSGRRGIPPFSGSPIAPTSPSAVFTSVMSPPSDGPQRGTQLFSESIINIYSASQESRGGGLVPTFSGEGRHERTSRKSGGGHRRSERHRPRHRTGLFERGHVGGDRRHRADGARRRRRRAQPAGRGHRRGDRCEQARIGRGPGRPRLRHVRRLPRPVQQRRRGRTELEGVDDHAERLALGLRRQRDGRGQRHSHLRAAHARGAEPRATS